MRRWIGIWLFWGVAGAARAAEPIDLGPKPSWVVAETPPALRADAGGYELRLLDIQGRLDASGIHEFAHQIVRLASPAAVQAAGTVEVSWQPATSHPTVHQVLIRRGAQEIDVLRGGATFNVIRREPNLEALQIDGVLTAVLQVPDLRIGDELEVSFTVDKTEPVLGGLVDNENLIRQSIPIDRLNLRYSWPRERAVRWRNGEAMPAATVEQVGGFTTVIVTGVDIKPVADLAQAPTRYLDDTAFQISEFPTWRAVADAMAPLFADAARISAGSPLNEEIRTIAASNSDPKVRAAMALRLVQTQVRYFARFDGLGGYAPQSAEAVWRARAGDCKGKAALLVALLRGLDIDAAPALVSIPRGDGTDKALPMARRFNHVLVRAAVAGKIYWLDGTRSGDGDLDHIDIPDFKWALPLAEAHRTLEPLVAGAPVAPIEEWRLDLDARAGVGTPAKAHGEGVFRGDAAAAIRSLASLMSREDRDNTVRKIWQERHDWVTVDRVSYATDQDSGEVRIAFDGTGKMDWDTQGASPGDRYEANKARLGEDLAPKRDAATAQRAPVVVNARYKVVHQTILLPNEGKGFVLEGEAVDATIGSVHYQRTLSLKDGRFEMMTSTRSAPGELGFTDAMAADKKTDALFAKQVFIDLPATDSARAARTQASGLREVDDALSANNWQEALTLADKLLAAGAQDAPLIGARAIALHGLGRIQEADRAYDEALALDRTNRIALVGKIQLLLDRGRFDDAMLLADRLALVSPEVAESYKLRGEARHGAGDLEGAEADWAIALQKGSADENLRYQRTILFLEMGKKEQAVAEARAYVKAAPSSELAYALLGNMLALAGRSDEAAGALDRSIQIAPNADAYMTRVHFGLSGDRAATLLDMLQVIRLAPDRQLPTKALAVVLAAPGAREKLDAAYAAVRPSANVDMTSVKFARAAVAAAAGQPEPMLAEYDDLIARTPNRGNPLNNACWYRATHGLQLDRALAQCTAAIAINPAPAYFDSRGLVQLRRGADHEAIADYDTALNNNPRLPTSFFGRGIAKLRLGDRTGGEADLAAARKLSQDVDATFAEMGIAPR